MVLTPQNISRLKELQARAFEIREEMNIIDSEAATILNIDTEYGMGWIVDFIWDSGLDIEKLLSRLAAEHVEIEN